MRLWVKGNLVFQVLGFPRTDDCWLTAVTHLTPRDPQAALNAHAPSQPHTHHQHLTHAICNVHLETTTRRNSESQQLNPNKLQKYFHFRVSSQSINIFFLYNKLVLWKFKIKTTPCTHRIKKKIKWSLPKTTLFKISFTKTFYYLYLLMPIFVTKTGSCLTIYDIQKKFTFLHANLTAA